MGIVAWIILGLVAGLLANMLIPGRRQQGLILTCLIGIAGGPRRRLGRHQDLSHPHPARLLQRLHLDHRHRRGGRPSARLPPDHPPVRRVPAAPPVRAPLTRKARLAGTGRAGGRAPQRPGSPSGCIPAGTDRAAPPAPADSEVLRPQPIRASPRRVP